MLVSGVQQSDSVYIYICCCCFSVAESYPILCDPMNGSMAGYRLPGFPVHHCLPEFPQTHIHWVLSQWCHPTISSSVVPLPPALNFPQHQGLFQGVSSSYQVAKVLEPQLQHQSFQWIFRLISFRIDRFVLLAVQRTYKSLLKHHSSKVSVLWHSAFFMVHLSHPYMTTGKTIALTIWTCWQSDVSAF